MCVYMCVCTCVCICVCMHIYIHTRCFWGNIMKPVEKDKKHYFLASEATYRMAKIHNPSGKKKNPQILMHMVTVQQFPCKLSGCRMQLEGKKLLLLDILEQDCFHEGSYSRKTWILTVTNLFSEQIRDMLLICFSSIVVFVVCVLNGLSMRALEVNHEFQKTVITLLFHCSYSGRNNA